MHPYSNIKPSARPLGIPRVLMNAAKGAYPTPVKPSPVSLSLREALGSTRSSSFSGPPAGLTPKAAALTASGRGQLDIAGLLQQLKSLQAPAPTAAPASAIQPMGTGGPAGGPRGQSAAQGAPVHMSHGSASGYITNLARHLGIDPKAARAVASVEGGLNFGGPVGDSGTSGGPYQLHRGGALPSGRSVAWAATPEGVAYALQQIARVARGKHGYAAIAAIVRRFERPANPGAEVQKAWGRYGRV